MTGPVFVDTNVLVYARHAGHPAKQRRAAAWMADLWGSRRGRVSFQVLQEYYATVTQKLRPAVPPDAARADVRNLLRWRPAAVNAELCEQAWRVQDRFRFSYWDSLIVAAAQIQACRTLLTEDLEAGQDLDGVRVVNPFETAPE